jgi:hypothetical protein
MSDDVRHTMSRNERILLSLLLAALGVLALGYNALGFYCLVADTTFSYPIDLRLRWVEQRLMAEGLNPQEHGHPDPELPATHEAMRTRGGGYPPWAYALNMLFVPPWGWNAARWYFAGLNLLAMAAIGAWAYRRAGGCGRLYAGLGAASVLAIFPAAVCTSYGQAGVLVLACLVGYCVSLEKGRGWLAGLFLAMALVKPQLSALFVIPPLIRREFRPALVAGLAVAAAGWLAAWLVGSDPLSMFAKFSDEARSYAFLSHNPLILAVQNVLGFEAGTLLVAAAGAGLAVLLCVLRRHDRSYLTSFALCAILSMFWSYRRHYDCVLLAIPLIGLLIHAVQTRSKAALGLFLAFGALLWSPLRLGHCALPAIQYVQIAVWLAALMALACSNPRPDEGRLPS